MASLFAQRIHLGGWRGASAVTRTLGWTSIGRPFKSIAGSQSSTASGSIRHWRSVGTHGREGRGGSGRGPRRDAGGAHVAKLLAYDIAVSPRVPRNALLLSIATKVHGNDWTLPAAAAIHWWSHAAVCFVATISSFGRVSPYSSPTLTMDCATFARAMIAHPLVKNMHETDAVLGTGAANTSEHS